MQRQMAIAAFAWKGPDNDDVALFVRQRTILSGIGAQFMERHGNRKGLARREMNVRTFDAETTLAAGMRLDRVGDNLR